MTLLSMSGVHAGYELEILHGVTIHVRKGEIVSLIGPNGAGKSTVLKAIYGIAAVSNGEIRFNGQRINSEKTHELSRKRLCYVPQGKINFGNLTVEENLTIGNQGDVTDAYRMFPVLQEKKKKLAWTLSGGQHQMLALGRALMQKPELLMLDEPSLGLSPQLQAELFRKIESLRDEGMALLIVEQNAKKAIHISDRTYLLEDGKVVLEGGKDIIKHPKIVEVYLGGRY